jgi:hypothetical protein
MMITTALEDHIQKAVDHKVPPFDIMHGELKRLLVDAEEQLMLAQENEERTGEAKDSMERTYWEGQCDALSNLYTLTYGIYFAISDRDEELTESNDSGNI